MSEIKDEKNILKIAEKLHGKVANPPHHRAGYEENHSLVEELAGKEYKVEKEELAIKKLINESREELVQIIHEDNNITAEEQQAHQLINQIKEISDSIMKKIEPITGAQTIPMDTNRTDLRNMENKVRELRVLIGKEVDVTRARNKLADKLRDVLKHLEGS